MNIHNATEIAYKNGYEQAKKDLISAIELLEKQALAKAQSHALNHSFYSGKYSAYHKVTVLLRNKHKEDHK